MLVEITQLLEDEELSVKAASVEALVDVIPLVDEGG